MSADPITLLLGADSLAGSRSGVGRMTLEIARQLETHADIADYGFLIDGEVHLREGGRDFLNPDDGLENTSQAGAFRENVKRQLARIAAVRMLRDGARRRRLNSAAHRLGGDGTSPVLYHEPNMITVPYDGPSVATFNDLAWHWDPGMHPRGRVQWIERNLPRVIRETARFVAISSFTAAETVRLLGIERKRIDVVPLAPALDFKPMSSAAAAPVLKTYGLDDQSYVLSVSTLEPRKNFDRLLAAYLGMPQHIRSRFPLVIAGGKGWGNVLKQAGSAIASGELRLLGHIPDADLVALTARCAVFAYVSLYEGFGLPIVEAMATGAPVLASSTTASGETAGDGALLVDPQDEEDIRSRLRSLLEEPGIRRIWHEAGLRRSAEFSWRITADHLVASWHTALGHDARSA